MRKGLLALWRGKNTWSLQSTPTNRYRSINPCTHRTNGQRTKPYCRKPSSIARYPVPSACYRKSKRREDVDLTTGLRNNGEPHRLPGRGGGTSRSSKLLFHNSGLTANARLHLTHQWMSVTACLCRFSTKHEASEASTASTTRLCSPITRVMFFTIRRELKQVMRRDSRY